MSWCLIRSRFATWPRLKIPIDCQLVCVTCWSTASRLCSQGLKQKRCRVALFAVRDTKGTESATKSLRQTTQAFARVDIILATPATALAPGGSSRQKIASRISPSIRYLIVNTDWRFAVPAVFLEALAEGTLSKRFHDLLSSPL